MWKLDSHVKSLAPGHTLSCQAKMHLKYGRSSPRWCQTALIDPGDSSAQSFWDSIREFVYKAKLYAKDGKLAGLAPNCCFTEEEMTQKRISLCAKWQLNSQISPGCWNQGSSLPMLCGGSTFSNLLLCISSTWANLSWASSQLGPIIHLLIFSRF